MDILIFSYTILDSDFEILRDTGCGGPELKRSYHTSIESCITECKTIKNCNAVAMVTKTNGAMRSCHLRMACTDDLIGTKFGMSTARKTLKPWKINYQKLRSW